MKWYKQDSNAIEVVYQLQPITDHFPNYVSKDLDLRSKDQNGWWLEFKAIQNTFWQVVRAAVQNGTMSLKRAHFYYQSGNFFSIYVLDSSY